MRAEPSLRFRIEFQDRHQASRLQVVDVLITQKRAQFQTQVILCKFSVAVLRRKVTTKISIDTRNQAVCKPLPTLRYPERANQKKEWIWVSKWNKAIKTSCICQEISSAESIPNSDNSSRRWCTPTYSTLSELVQLLPSIAMIKSINITLLTQAWWSAQEQQRQTSKMWWANFSIKFTAIRIIALIGTPSRFRATASYITATITHRRRLATKALQWVAPIAGTQLVKIISRLIIRASSLKFARLLRSRKSKLKTLRTTERPPFFHGWGREVRQDTKTRRPICFEFYNLS